MNIKTKLLSIFAKKHIPVSENELDMKMLENALKGVQKMHVVMEEIPELEKSFETNLQSAIELKLRQNGIDVNNEDAFSCLYININTSLNYSGNYICRVDVELYRLGEFRNDVGEYAPNMGVVWHKGAVGITYDINSIRSNTLAYVDKFLNDYLTVNPLRK